MHICESLSSHHDARDEAESFSTSGRLLRSFVYALLTLATLSAIVSLVMYPYLK